MKSIRARKKDFSKMSGSQICSRINSGYNGNPIAWRLACNEAHKRKIYFVQYDFTKSKECKDDEGTV